MLIKFKIHPFFYLFGFIMVINGLFKDYIYITLILIVHELGHILAAIIYNWKIERVIILPFGCLTIFNELLNRKIKEEFIIVLMGPIFQIIFFLIFKNIFLSDLFIKYHYILLFLNLIAIYPLDGSKILNLILNKFLSYYTSFKINIYVSYFFLILMFLYNIKYKNIMLFLYLLLLFINVLKENKNIKYRFKKFMYERYLYKLEFNKSKIIKNEYQMKRDYRHIFNINKKYYLEKEILSNIFDNDIKLC